MNRRVRRECHHVPLLVGQLRDAEAIHRGIEELGSRRQRAAEGKIFTAS